MRKRKKKSRTAIYKKNCVEKCIKVETVQLNEEEYAILDEMFERYRQCKDMFLKRLCGIGSILNIQSFQNVRNMIRKEQNALPNEYGNKSYCDIFEIQGRFWVMALSDTCMTLKSMWTNLGNKCKAKLRDNHTDLSKPERTYCNYILSSPKILYCILNECEYTGSKSKNYRRILDDIKDVPEIRIKYIHSMLRRLVRDNKPYPEAKKADCILMDEVMYKITSEKDADYILLMTNSKGTKLKLKLKSRFCYNKKGNTQIVFNREKRTLSIHKCIKARQSETKKGHPVGIDKGYATLISCNDGNGKKPEYGENFGKLISAESERINKKNTNRNYFYDKCRKLQDKLNQSEDKSERELLRELISKTKRCHLGKKKYNKKHTRAMKHMESVTNHNIRMFMNEMEPSEIVLEDLSFVTDRKKPRTKSYNRKMSSWQKGILDERLVYIAKIFGAETIHVNAAYTSQYCCICGSKLGLRYGKHSGLAECEICGTVNANTNAAGNILARKTDRKIMQYTPYKEVKAICDKRAEALNAAVEHADIW